jgi:hypothetical protein
MSGSSEGEGFWPGFVDALGNIVIALIFVVLVLAIAMSFSAQIFSKKLAEKMLDEKLAAMAAAAKASGVAPGSLAAPGMPPSDSIARTLIAVSGPPAEKASGASTTMTSARGIELQFDNAAVALDGDATQALKTAIRKETASGAPVSSVQIVAVGPQMQLSEQQRAAFLRMMSVRNEVLESGIPPEKIEGRIDAKQPAAKPTVLVTFNRGGR